jgi:hypothetical protein
MERISVPFSSNTFDPTGGGLTQQSVEGLIRLDANEVVIEYRQKTLDWSGMTKAQLSDVHVVHIPLEDVESIEVRGWLFWRRVVLRTHSLSVLRDVPWANGAELSLKLPFGAHQRAQELTTTTALRQADRTLRQLESYDEPRSLPNDGQTQ